jgi:hypothetical protein
MKIELVTPQEIIGLRSRLPRSTFMNETFDEYILGIHKETGSIVYNLYGVIHAMIKKDYPELKVEVESDEWFDAYDEINERLSISNAFYGLEALLENSDDFQKNGLSVSYTLSGDLDLINFNGDKKTLEFTTNLNLL